MNRQQLTDSFLHNWPVKVICFTIAVFLYLFYQASLIDKKTFVIPLEVQENGIVVHIGTIPTSVVVSVRANENDVKAIFASDMKATINLDNIVESGVYKIPIHVEISDKLKALDPLEVKLKEERLKIEVEKKVSRYVVVNPSIVGEVAEDYELKEVKMTPSTVEIRGPESLIEAITNVATERVNVSNAMTNFSVETIYKQISSLIEIVDTAPCKATVIVEPKIEEKTFMDLPIKVLNLDDKLEISGEMPKYSITLKGEAPQFKKYDINRNTIKLDLGEIKEPGTYELPVIYSLSQKFQLISNSGETVTITVVEKNDKDSEADKKEA